MKGWQSIFFCKSTNQSAEIKVWVNMAAEDEADVLENTSLDHGLGEKKNGSGRWAKCQAVHSSSTRPKAKGTRLRPVAGLLCSLEKHLDGCFERLGLAHEQFDCPKRFRGVSCERMHPVRQFQNVRIRHLRAYQWRCGRHVRRRA